MTTDLRKYRTRVLYHHGNGTSVKGIAKVVGLTKTQVELILIAWGPRP